MLITGSRQAHKLALPFGAIVGHHPKKFVTAFATQWAHFLTSSDAMTPIEYANIHTTGKKGVLNYNAYMLGNRLRFYNQGDEVMEPSSKKPKNPPIPAFGMEIIPTDSLLLLTQPWEIRH
ncbi:hypothetical protein GE061_007752 [Apolygus lucorum]|uniref:Uncharacterized protein n=1 Tax=Apolygus lucorum TaxID=248454 RepID=A0A8S9WMN5_APOLU|nr:hypothetical protein GE061_007752 [Apolygus lucorum]